MKTNACPLLVMLLAFLSVPAVGQPLIEQPVRAAGDDAGDTSDTQIVGFRQRMFREVGPRRSVLVGIEVYYGKFGNNDVVHGVRPIFLDAQGREQLGSLHGKDTGRPLVRVKAKRGYAVGAISVRNALTIDGLSVTFMKLEKGRLNPDQSYESDWLGGQGGGGPTRLESSGEPVIGVFGSQNNNSEINGLGLILSNKPIVVAAAAQKKLPLPSEAAQAQALKLAKEVYGEAWAAAKSPSQKREPGAKAPPRRRRK